MEIVKLIVRVFENKENCEMFSAILEKKWPKLLGENDRARFRAIINKLSSLMYYLFYGSLKIQKHINTLSKLLKKI